MEIAEKQVLKLGQSMSSTFTITAEDVKKFEQISGDTNLIHQSDLEAAKLGSPIGTEAAPGALTICKLSGVLGTQFPGHGTVWAFASLKFRRPVIVGMEHTMTLKVEKIRYANRAIIQCVITDVCGMVCALGEQDVLNNSVIFEE